MSETAASLLGRMPPAAGTVFLGLPGPLAEVVALRCEQAHASRRGPRGLPSRPGIVPMTAAPGPPVPLPWVVDRDPVLPADVASGCYPPTALGRARRDAVFSLVARRTALVLPSAGAHPEQPWVHDVLREVLAEDAARIPTARPPGREGAGGPAAGGTRRSGSRRGGTGLRGGTRPSGLPADLQTRVDLVVLSVDALAPTEWDLPLAPSTPVLLLVRLPSGEVVCLGRTTWAERPCPVCLVDRAAAREAALRSAQRPVSRPPDCLCRLGADHPAPPAALPQGLAPQAR